MAKAPPPTRAPLARAALDARCPLCDDASMFDGIVTIKDSCPACGFDYSRFNVGDGPAAFLILIVGAIVAVAAIWLELSVGPPWFVHIVWVPIILILTMSGLRFAKALLLHQEYRMKAGSR